MSAEHGAEEHLRAIRQLMERATVYRAISAPTALVGGLLSLGLVLGLGRWLHGDPQRELDGRWFYAAWVFVLGLTGLANTFFLWQGARLRHEPLISAGMKHALLAVAPSFLTGGALSAVWAYGVNEPALIAFLWILFYGLGLLATQSFAPRSIIVLGSAFLVAAFAYIALAIFGADHHRFFKLLPLAALGATFGGYHLLYAGTVWALDRRKALDAVEDRPLVTEAYPPLP